MDNAKLVAALCEIIDGQNAIIQAQAVELAQYDALAYADEINALGQKYAETIGGAIKKRRCEA